MMITFDGHIMAIQPDSLQWHPPQEIAKDGNFAPIRGQYWSVTFALPKTTVASIQDWYDIFTAGIHAALLPHPRTLAMTSFVCYVNNYSVRMNTEDECPYVSGLDVELSGIVI